MNLAKSRTLGLSCGSRQLNIIKTAILNNIQLWNQVLVEGNQPTAMNMDTSASIEHTR
jgi:hypothetical protein